MCVCVDVGMGGWRLRECGGDRVLVAEREAAGGGGVEQEEQEKQSDSFP